MRNREAFETTQANAELVTERAAENALLLHVAGTISGKWNDFDGRTSEPAGGIHRKEQQGRIPGHLLIVNPCRDAHSPVDVFCVRLVQQPASRIPQVLANL